MFRRHAGMLILVILVLCVLMSVSFAEGEDSGFVIDEKTHTLLKYEGEAETVEIPEGIEYIGYCAFEGSSVRQVVMPDSVISIGSRAFAACEELQQIRLSANLLSIGDYAFFDCYALESLELPEGLVYIGSYAFSWYATSDGMAPGYSVIRIPASVVQLSPKQASFSGWVTLNDCPRFEVDPGNRFYRVEDGMLIGHGILMQYRDPEDGNPVRIVTVPEDVTAIAPCAFYGTCVLSVKMSAGMQKIGQAAFAVCGYLMDLTIDCETTLVEQGIVFSSGVSEYIVSAYDAETYKDMLRQLTYYDKDGNERSCGIGDEILDQLPDRPTLTLLNVEEWNMSADTEAEDLPWYISSFNDYSELYMDIGCDPDWAEIFREKNEIYMDEGYGSLSFTEQGAEEE